MSSVDDSVTTPAKAPRRRASPTSRRIGYAVAIAVDIALVVVVNNLLAWGWPPFLTDEFEDVLPIVNVSLVASIAVNVVYLLFDREWFKSITQIALGAISLAVVIRTLQVFPFDFSEYALDWAAITRALLVVVAVAISLGIIVQLVGLIRTWTPDRHTTRPPGPPGVEHHSGPPSVPDRDAPSAIVDLRRIEK